MNLHKTLKFRPGPMTEDPACVTVTPMNGNSEHSIRNADEGGKK